MKKYSLSTQIMLMILFVLTISATLFSIIVISRLNSVYEQQGLDRLDAAITLTKNKWDNGEYDELDFQDTDLSLYFLTGNLATGIVYYDSLFDCFTSEDEIQSFLVNISWIRSTSGNGYFYNLNSEKIYFSYQISSSGNYMFLFTDESYVSTLKTETSIQVILIFFSVFAFSGIIIMGWSKNVSNRLYRIQTHVKNLTNSNYNDKYIDDGHDEIAELSRAVETMRLQLLNAEHDKREMLQNLSHDFKTPISVIKSYAEALADKMVTDQEASEIVSEQSSLLQYKVNKLLQYNRLEYLSADEEFVDVNMLYVVENVLKNYKYQTDLNVILDLEDTYFKGYEENYYTVIENILDNAKRYAKSYIKLTLKDNKLIIYNDGEHIEDKFINGLFKAYEKGSKGEFGLGMSIVKKTLDFFDMELNVVNEEVGVSFIISKKKKQLIHSL